MINLSTKVHEEYVVSDDDIKEYENNYGSVPENSFVIIYTGLEKYWPTPEKYRNNLIFPSISSEAAELLLRRNIVGLGIDTLSPDREGSHFPVHQIILGAGKYIVENIANANQLPAIGSIIIGLPLKIKDGTEAPMRLAGIMPLQ